MPGVNGYGPSNGGYNQPQGGYNQPQGGYNSAGANNNYDAIGTRQNIKVIDSKTSRDGTIRIDVLEYQSMLGATNTVTAQKLYFMGKQNIRVRQIAVYINNGGVEIQPGAMSYFLGNLEMTSGVTLGNALGRMVKGKLTGEAMAQPKYQGSGMLVLEPSFKHFIIAELEAGETIITDKGMFYVAQQSVQVKPIMNSQISAALLGGEGIFQTAMTGPGLVVLEAPVPMCEIDIIELNNDILRVDGNFALLRSGNIQFTVERSSRTLIGSAVSGEGLVNVFRGTGQVWIAPTLKAYQAINASNIYGGNVAAVDMNTSNSGIRTMLK